MASTPGPGVVLSDAGVSLSLFGLARASRERQLFVNDRPGLTRIAQEMEEAVLAERLPARIFVGFQKWSFARPVVARYAELAKHARGVWLFGLPDVEPPALPGITWVALSERHALVREWFVVVDAASYFAVLAADALDGFDVAPARRRFQAVWSFDATLVHDLGARLVALLGLAPEAVPAPREHAAQLARVGVTVSGLLRELGERQAALQRAERLREDLTGLLVHDLRNPLSVILARTELLTKMANPTGELISRSAAAINSEARRLDEMLVSLLDVTRFEAGRMQLAMADVEIRPLVAGVVDMFRPIAQVQDKAIAVGVDLPAEAGLTGDREKLARVLGNLIGNALKYSDRGGHVEVRVRTTAAGVEFAVSDDGPSVPPEGRELVFQRFGQIGGEAQRPGTGLGLYFARLVVEGHGGTIGVENRPGRGATFRFTVPGRSAG
jgi:signal transduction histidine kinase